MSGTDKERLEEFSRENLHRLKELVAEGAMAEKDAEECNMLSTRFFSQKLTHETGIDWSKIAPMPTEEIIDMLSPEETEFKIKDIISFFNKLVVLKLNGGLGTSMGCSYPKSCIEIRDGLTFLHVILKQISSINDEYGVDIPLVLMNSDWTEAETKKMVEKAKTELKIDPKVYHFNQPMYPRMDLDTLMPTTKLSKDDPDFWYPPGHASVLTSFKNSGLAKKFAEMGKEWVFISNADNLGAIPDGRILGSIIKYRTEMKASTKKDFSFFMETTKKTKIDIKGGTPVLYDGVPFLLEASQVPKEHESDFTDLKKFTLFNTQNIWIHLGDWLKKDTFKLPIIYNPKVVSDHDGKNATLVQLEMAVGSALSQFNSVILAVSRHRFIPVKYTCDLLRLQSDLFKFHKDGTVEPLVEKLPEVILSDEFKTIEEFKRRIPGHVSLIHAKKVKLKGNIIIQGDVEFAGRMTYSSAGDFPLRIKGKKKKF